MNKQKLLSIFLFLPSLLYGQVIYFEAVNDFSALDTQFCVPVTRILADSPAKKAGLLNGDRIVGLDGLRVRDSNEYALLRFYFDSRNTVALTVVRGGNIVKLKIKDPFPIRRAGFVMDISGDVFLRSLSEWDLDLGGRQLFKPLPGKLENHDATEDLTKAFDVQKPRIASQSARLLALFPAKGQDLITALMAKKNVDSRELVEDILTVYLHLRFGESVEAQKIMAEKTLKERTGLPFLKELVTFYDRISKSPPVFGTERLWERYGVDLFFFTVCYPHPVGVEDANRMNVSGDSKFQVLFDVAANGMWIDRNAMDMAARRYVNDRSAASMTDKYLNTVRAALFCGQNHGGWPYSDTTMTLKRRRTEILSCLKNWLKERPDDRVLMAFAILCPALINHDKAMVEKVYRILAEAGERERAIANGMIYRTIRYWRAEQSLADVVVEYERKMKKTSFHEYLIKAGPAFRYMEHYGSCIRRGDRMLDWALLIRANLASVARALESPVYVDDIQETVKLVLSGTKPDLLRRAFDMVVRDLSEHPQEVRLKDFMRLAKKMPAGEVFDAVSIIVGYHNCLNHSGVIDVRALFQDLFYSVENKHYEKIFTEINSIKEDTPDIRKKMDDIYALAGTPATCLLLSNKIKSAGDRQSAEFYRRKTVDFLANVNSYCIDDRNSYLRWKAIRDLASIPGFQEEARNYQDKVHLRNVDSLFIMEAILDSYTGNIEGVIRKMEKSVGRHIRKDKDTYIYDGRLYRTVKGVREALLGNVIKQTNLSAEHIDRISRLGGIDLKVILTKLKGDEICDTQSQFSFEMKDGTTVVGVIDVKSIMVKTSYADIDLSVEKILSITLRSGRKSSEVHLRNNDVVIGGVDMGSINVKTRDGQVSVNGKDLRMMTLYISSVDRFRREIKRLSAGKR